MIESNYSSRTLPGFNANASVRPSVIPAQEERRGGGRYQRCWRNCMDDCLRAPPPPPPWGVGGRRRDRGGPLYQYCSDSCSRDCSGGNWGGGGPF